MIVLDRFEHFCNMARQTLLYNLFNLAQDLSTLAFGDIEQAGENVGCHWHFTSNFLSDTNNSFANILFTVFLS